MAHRNARLTPHGRLLLCRRIEDEGWTVAAAAEAAGVSRQTASKWRRRLALEGPAGLADRSSARRRPPQRIGGAPAAPHRRPAPAPARRPALDRLAHRRRALERLRGAAPPGPEPPARPGAARAGGALLLAARRRPRPPRHQEAGAHRAGRRLALRRPRPPRRATAASAGTSCTWPSTTPPGSPTPRSCPTSAARRRPPSWSAPWPSTPRTGIEVQRLLTDNGSPTARAPSAPWPRSAASGTCSRGPTGRRPTARPRRS